jgi:cell division protein FtsW (lipid II flippase)
MPASRGWFSAMDEVARLQHELAMLRERYAIIERNGRRIRVFCLLAPIPLAFLAVYALWKDVVAAAFFLAFIAIVAILLRLLLTESTERFRWIDFGTPGSEFDHRGPSEARKVEAAIAQREARSGS